METHRKKSMKLHIIDSGSRGNCCILFDNNGNQLMIDCGVKYEKIATMINWDNHISCIVTHKKHSDHGLSVDKLIQCGIDVYTHGNFTNVQTFTINNVWNILPIELPHDKDTTSYSFIIYNTIENKTIYFATDCTQLPQLADKKYDLLMIENNYDEETVATQTASGNSQNCGYLRHLSLEYVQSWLCKFANKPKNLVITHLSNSGNISISKIKTTYNSMCDNLYIAQKNMEIQI